MKSDNPLVSILLPVYNCKNLLINAVDSVKKQTFQSWELIIIDDGSDAETKKLIADIKKSDDRIKVISNETNKGIIYSLNRAIEIVSAKYTARIDCDDIWLPKKLEKQVNFLEANPEYVMVATWAKIFAFGKEVKNPAQARYSTYNEIRNNLMKSNFIVHSSILYRSDILKKEKYSTEFLHAEDYELWLRTAHKYKIFILPEPLTIYNFSFDSVSSRYVVSQQFNVIRLKIRYLAKYPKYIKSVCYLVRDIFEFSKFFSAKTFRKFFPRKN
jgi:glycosyltransferase involved in cell wall biosynthesis